MLTQDMKDLVAGNTIRCQAVHGRQLVVVLRIHVAPALDEGRGQLGPVVVDGHLHQHRRPGRVVVLHLRLAAPREHFRERLRVHRDAPVVRRCGEVVKDRRLRECMCEGKIHLNLTLSEAVQHCLRGGPARLVLKIVIRKIDSIVACRNALHAISAENAGGWGVLSQGLARIAWQIGITMLGRTVSKYPR